MPGITAPRDHKEADEERDRGNGEHWNGLAQSGSHLGSGAGGGVAAHTAALTMRGERKEEKQRGYTSAKEMNLRSAKHRYWKKTSRANRKIQKIPIECQYQAVQSTKICRISRRWSSVRHASAAISAAMPRTR